MEELLTIGYSITGFIIILLLKKKIEFNSQKFAIALLSLWFLRFSLYYIKTWIDVPSLVYISALDQNLFFLDGVFVFWYVKSLHSDCKFSLQKEILHLIPFLIGLGISLKTVISLTNKELRESFDQIVESLDNKSFTPELSELLFIFAIVIHNFIYVLLSFRKAKAFRVMLKNNVSSLDKTDVIWISKFLKAWLVLLTLPMGIYFLNYLKPTYDVGSLALYMSGSMVLYAIVFGINLIEQKYIINYTDSAKSSAQVICADEIQEVEQLYSRLGKVMQEQRPYLQEGLSLKELAELVQVKPNRLSTAINRKTSKNFYEYINAFRIDSVKSDLLESNEQIIQIAYQNGFSSKSTFNDAFKKSTGLTPSQFRKQYKSNK